MTIKKTLRMADIQTSDILFYDDGVKDRCYKLCAERNIDCLPGLDDPRVVYMRDDVLSKFRAEALMEDRRVSADANIFDPQVIEKFRRQPLLLIYQGNEMSGVVHFSDYNQPQVSSYLYELFFEYEKALRALLIRSGLKNVDMIAYYSDQKTKSGQLGFYETRINDYFKFGSQKKLPQFEVFNLADLIALTNHKRIIKLTDKTRLRNIVMHANESINTQDPGVENFIYDFETFENFFRWCQELFQDLKRVNNRLVFTF